ncbi:hypothetical protein [Streptomyces sp. SID13031]|uniref:hypothetical protein n=1 Tax=Streptomyces sp. SID13031 TaxID=2706046 RepID=UPI001941F348|nr:hypothetical protein [Streptomyces sp. SID13031]
MFVGFGIAAGSLAQLLHSQVTAAERATMVSVQSLLLQLAGAVGAVALGYLAALAGPLPAFLVAAALLALPVARLVVPEPVRA